MFKEKISFAMEKSFIKAAKRGDLSARNYLVEQYYPYVIKQARGLYWTGVDFEDLCQEGALGIMDAIEPFRASKGVRFISYASWHIKNRIHKYVYRNHSVVRNMKTQKLKARFYKDKKSFECIEFNEYCGGSFVDPVEALHEEDIKRFVKGFCKRDLTGREGDVMERLLHGGSQKAVGERWGVSRERARQVEKNLCKRLKMYVSFTKEGRELVGNMFTGKENNRTFINHQHD